MSSINDRLKQIQIELFDGNGAMFARKTDIPQSTMSNYTGNRRSAPDIENLEKIINSIELLNADWLITGRGSMIKTSSSNIGEPSAEYNIHPRKNFNFKGSPYYDIDFIGGFDLICSDHTVNPDYYIDLPPYNKEGVLWCNLYGKSMEPYILSGDRIAVTEIQVYDIVFGKVYGVITKAGLRTVKWVVRSPESRCYRLIPENKDPKFGDHQDISIDDIFKMYLVMGAVRPF